MQKEFRVVMIALPPLGERKEDIPLLADYFLKQYAAEAKKNDLSFHPQTIEAMCRHDWPGNVRGAAACNRAGGVLTTGRVILADDLPLSIRDVAASEEAFPPFPLMPLDELQRRYLIRVLREIPNRNETARILGVDRRTLYRMARRYGIPLADERGEASPSSE